jgi:hypothetical protein
MTAKTPNVNNIHWDQETKNNQLSHIMEFDYLGKHYKGTYSEPAVGYNDGKAEIHIKISPNNDIELHKVTTETIKNGSGGYDHFVEYWDKITFSGDSFTLVEPNGYAAVFTPIN